MDKVIKLNQEKKKVSGTIFMTNSGSIFSIISCMHRTCVNKDQYGGPDHGFWGKKHSWVFRISLRGETHQTENLGDKTK